MIALPRTRAFSAGNLQIRLTNNNLYATRLISLYVALQQYLQLLSDERWISRMPSEEDWNKIRYLEADRAYWQQELRDVYEAERASGNTLDGSSSIPRRLEQIDRELKRLKER